MLTWLFERFASAPDKEALVWRDRPTTYGQLRELAQTWGRELRTRGLEPGTVVSLESDYSPNAIALLLALIHARMTVVPLTSTVQQRKPQFREIAQVQAAFQLEPDDRWSFRPGPARHAGHLLHRRLAELGHPGLVLFSSGTTGEPKAALHDFTYLLEKFKVPRHSRRTITFLLLDHIGGLNTLLYVLSNTGAIVVVEDRNADAVCATIERHRVELLPTSPTFLNLLLLSEAHTRHDLSSLSQITYGTEPMPESTLRRIHEVLPGVALLQTYGLSEVGILRSKSKSSDSLLVKVGGEGYETKVVDGTLWIRAASSMLGYLNAPSPFDADGWLNTGDEVIVEGEYLRILGRRSELINVGGEKVYPAEVESVILDMPEVADVSVRGEPNPITGNMVVARVTVERETDPNELRKRVRDHCRGKLAPFQIPAKVELALDPQYTARFKKMRRVDI
ncbi:MAG: AMP-binding protein [Polyangiaceae bacterium]|nr:AMP-binding protein [Polyangiaceae bacterium]